MSDGKRVGQTAHPIAHAWDQLVAKPVVHMIEGIRGVGHPRATKGAVGSSPANTPSAEPLEGATVFVLRYQSTTVSLLQTVTALGGTEAVTLEEATHCLVPSGLGLGVSPATRRVLRRAKERNVAVVEATPVLAAHDAAHLAASLWVVWGPHPGLLVGEMTAEPP